MINWTRNIFLNRSRYREHSQAVIVSCYFNPQNSEYRKKAFDTYYDSIKHLNHRIIECVIGDSKPQLPETANIQRLHTENLLWHKESLLNLAISKLPTKYKYVFWLDTDITFTNKNWLVDSVAELKTANILQPFEYCVHLDQDEVKPSYKIKYGLLTDDIARQPKVWRSFCANWVDDDIAVNSLNYDVHGHVGFAWGARRELLEAIPLYDKALIGGADHIIAHAAAGQIPHRCIDKSFTDDLDAVYKWARQFNSQCKQKLAYVKGDLYHLWHGDIEKREYLKRIQEFTPETKTIVAKDSNGLYVTKKGDSPYIKEYFKKREVGGGGGGGSCGRGCTHTDHTTIHTHIHTHTGSGSSSSGSGGYYDNNDTGGYYQ